MEMLQPLEGAGNQKALHLLATEIVDQRVPVPMKALARVFMLIKRAAVKACQAPDIGRKMGRHPIEKHADTARMAAVDEIGQILRRAIAPGGENRPSG